MAKKLKKAKKKQRRAERLAAVGCCGKPKKKRCGDCPLRK